MLSIKNKFISCVVIFLLFLTLYFKGKNFTFIESRADFGRVFPGDSSVSYVTVRNFGLNSLAIDSVSTSCGCSNAFIEKYSIKPFSSERINFEIRTKPNSQVIDEYALVKIKGIKEPYKIRLKGEIYAPVYAIPRKIDIGSIYKVSGTEIKSELSLFRDVSKQGDWPSDLKVDSNLEGVSINYLSNSTSEWHISERKYSVEYSNNLFGDFFGEIRFKSNSFGFNMPVRVVGSIVGEIFSTPSSVFLNSGSVVDFVDVLLSLPNDYEVERIVSLVPLNDLVEIKLVKPNILRINRKTILRKNEKGLIKVVFKNSLSVLYMPIFVL